jgi:hypothetical protein
MRFSRNLGGGTKTNPIPHWGKGVPRYKVEGAVKSALAMNRRPWISDSTGSAFSSIDLSSCGCADRAGFHRRRIFSLSLGDIMDEEIHPDWLAEALTTIFTCADCTWILCSKRWTLKNFQSRLGAVIDAWPHLPPDHLTEAHLNMVKQWLDGQPPMHVVGLCSVENQPMADLRIPEFLKIPFGCRGLSLEPLLSPVSLTLGHDYRKWDVLTGHDTTFNSDGASKCETTNKIDWIITGAESGPRRRPCNNLWTINLVEQAQASGVAAFVKQVSINGKVSHNPNEWPERLRVQQWPKGF